MCKKIFFKFLFIIGRKRFGFVDMFLSISKWSLWVRSYIGIVKSKLIFVFWIGNLEIGLFKSIVILVVVLL